MRGWVCAPATTTSAVTTVVYCLAGGGCSTGYFDLDVPGYDDYSMATYLAQRDVVVVAVDHLGVGMSDRVDDSYAITPTSLADLHHHVVRTLVDGLRAGTVAPGLAPVDAPFVVGVGHSMGGMIAGLVQARHSPFGALAVLGHGGVGLPEVLTDDERAVGGPDLSSIEPEIERLARSRFAQGSTIERRAPRTGMFFTDDVPTEVRDAFTRQAVPLLPTCGLTSMIPGSTSVEQAAVTVPVFVAFGDHDLVDDHLAALAGWSSATDRTLYLLRDSGHCHNQAATRRQLWDRLRSWIQSIART
jgi:pimeloyl-ACP methyl ester carboxylesterase